MTAASGLGSFAISASAEETIVGDDVEVPASHRALGRGDQVGRYLLLDVLGQGAMGRVLRAYDPDLDRQVAIKLLFADPHQGAEQRERLLGEAKAMARIDHPNVVTVHDVGMHEGSVFIAMEIVDGPSLDRWLKTPRTPDAILDVLTGAARGLAAAHAAGVVHRDFKPANVLVTKDGRAKVGDFGLAGIEEATTSPSGGVDTSGNAMGTPAYMSPEHLVGVGVDARSDQFSFAITLYEALHGTRPFSATSWPELAGQIATGQVIPPLASRRRGIDGIVRRALSVAPEQRFASMDELIAAIERARRPAWRRWAALGTVAVVVGAAVLAREEGETCEAGMRRVRTVWGAPAKAALRIGGDDYTEALSRRARASFEAGLDDYAARWAAAYDESCAIVGPRAQQGTPAQQATAQCLDNRLDSLQGLAELAAAKPVDAGHVDALVATLPTLDDCTSGRWVPYPADPEQAARAAELHRTLASIHRDRIADRLDDLPERARAALEQARALGEPYLLAHALSQHARTLGDREAIDPLFDEALEVALAGGFDLLAAEIVNHVLLSVKRHDYTNWRELGHLAAMARGLVERGGGYTVLLGNLAINESNLLRHAGRHEQAMQRALEAEEHFAGIDHRDGMARARLTQVAVLMVQGRLDDVVERLRVAVQELEQANEGISPLTFQARQFLINGLIYTGRSREAYEAAAELHRQAQELYSLRSYTRRQAIRTHAGTALNVGQTQVALELLALQRALPDLTEAEAAEMAIFDLGLLQLLDRHEEVVQRTPEVRASFGPNVSRDERLALEVWLANSLLVLGRRDAVHAVLASPLVAESLRKPDTNESLRVMVVGLAVLSEAPPPPEGSWRSLVATGGLAAAFSNRKMLELLDAIEHEHEPLPTVLRIREELVAAYYEGEIVVQLIDAWIAARNRGAP